MRYLKQSPSVDSALINFFIRPSYTCRNENIIFFVNKCLVSNVGITRFKVRSPRLAPLNPMLFSNSAVSHVQKAKILGVSALLFKKEAYNLKVNTDDPIVFVILQQINDSLHVSIFFMKTN